jgi:hypothetical protein
MIPRTTRPHEADDRAGATRPAARPEQSLNVRAGERAVRSRITGDWPTHGYPELPFLPSVDLNTLLAARLLAL